MKTMEIVVCDFCGKDVTKVKSRTKTKNTFCNKRCHADYRTANFKTCSVESCNNKSMCNRLCQKHYDIFRNTEERRLYKKERHKDWVEKHKKLLESNPELKEKFRQKQMTAVRKYRNNNKELNKIRDKEYHKLPKRRFNQAKKTAERRGLVFEIDLKTYVELTKPDVKCYYKCGNFVPLTGMGLDRLDNRLGYTKNNVVPCCGVCNATKNSMITSVEMLEIVSLLKSIRNTDYIWEGKSTTRKK